MKKPGFHLPKLAWWLLIVSGFFHLSISLSNIFVNIFVFKVDHSFSAIAYYNLMVFVTLPITFVFASWLARRTSTAMVMRIGIGLHALFYMVTLFVGERAAHMPALLGILMGLGAGFYWLAFDVLSVEYTDSGGHEPFFGVHGLVTSVAGVVAPPIAGMLITREDVFFGGLTGYHIVFGISFALFLAATVFSFRLHSNKMERLQFRGGIAALKVSTWWRLMAASSIYGLREGVFMFLIGLLVFLATGSEMKLGEFLLLQGGLSFMSFYLAGKLSAKFRSRLFTFGAFGMGAAAILFLFPIGIWTVVIYGSLTAATLPFFLVPLQGFVYDTVETEVEQKAPPTTHIVVREWFENAGRVIGIVAFLLLCANGPKANLGKLSMVSFGLGLVQIGAWAILLPRFGTFIRRGRRVEHVQHDKSENDAGRAHKRLNPMS